MVKAILWGNDGLKGEHCIVVEDSERGLAAAMDVTEKFRAQETLRESEYLIPYLRSGICFVILRVSQNMIEL